MIVVKVGGSLYDMPDLKYRLIEFLDTLSDPDRLLVPGGGAAADAVRILDRTHTLPPDVSHALALRACSLNAHFLAVILGARVVPWPCANSGLAVLDSLAFVEADAGPDALPACWEATSDSVAARAAVVAGADLVLLKSVTIPQGMTWRDSSRAGFIDPLLPDLVERHGVRLRVVNLRVISSRRPSGLPPWPREA
jgi:aspartokinase-like uncharacterized kinase